MSSERLDNLKRFYELTGKLGESIGGARVLAECNGRLDWPRRGVYFFMEAGEVRTDTGPGPRIVRVGTHALKAGSGTTGTVFRTIAVRCAPAAAIIAVRSSG